MLDSEQKELLENGKLLLYTRNGIYYARVYVGNRKYIHRTLKTSKVGEARKLALRYLHEIEFKQAEALPLQQLSFNEVIKEYVALREREYERSKQDKVNTSTQARTSIFMLRQIKRVVKFWQEYCGKIAVDKIDNGLLQDYVQWRKDYYHKLPKDKLPKNARINPADKTIEWEMILARQLVKINDVLISTVRPNLNAVAMVMKEFKSPIGSTGFCVLRCDERKILPDIVFAIAKSKPFIKSMMNSATGASYPAVTDKIVKAYKVPVFKMEDQIKFVEFMRRVNKMKDQFNDYANASVLLHNSLQHQSFAVN
jgi:hypothetical protein